MIRLLLATAVAVGLAACGPKKPPAPPPAPPQPPPPPGETLRLKFTPGQQPNGKVKLHIEQELALSPKSPPKKVILDIDLLDEEKVEQVGDDGSATITARLADAVGKSPSGASEKVVDDFCLALDELKARFKRTSRGEVAGVSVSGVRAPLDENAARAILNAMYSAQRGAILPDAPTPVGGTWKVETALAPSTGFSGLVRYEYTYARKGAGVAVITSTGSIDGKGGAQLAGRKMTARSQGEYRLELESGRLIGSTSDVDIGVEEQGGANSVKQHFKVEWQLDESAK